MPEKVIVCKSCNWFLYDPKQEDIECCNCGKLYKKTNSKIENYNKGDKRYDFDEKR